VSLKNSLSFVNPPYSIDQRTLFIMANNKRQTPAPKNQPRVKPPSFNISRQVNATLKLISYTIYSFKTPSQEQTASVLLMLNAFA
jgi:hypothetical protein